MKMLTIEECKELPVDDLEKQINIRIELMNEMVGSLYPGIVYDEILKLRYLIRDRKRTG